MKSGRELKAIIAVMEKIERDLAEKLYVPIGTLREMKEAIRRYRAAGKRA